MKNDDLRLSFFILTFPYIVSRPVNGNICCHILSCFSRSSFMNDVVRSMYIGTCTRVVRKVRGHPLYNSTGTMNRFIMFMIIFDNVSGINMRKIM